MRHLYLDGNYTVIHDNEEEERLYFDDEIWRIESEHEYSAADAVLNARSGIAEHCYSKEVDLENKMQDLLY